MLTPAQYIKQNAPAAAENCIKAYLWSGVPFRESLNKNADYLCRFHYVPAGAFVAAVVDILRTITTPQAFATFIDKRRALTVSPCYKSAADYIKGEFETDCTAADIARIIRLEISTCRE